MMGGVGQRRQHHKGKKRPGNWHQGRSEGKKQDEFLRKRMEPAYDRAADDQAVVRERSEEHRRETRDYAELLAQLDRTSPHVPAWEMPL